MSDVLEIHEKNCQRNDATNLLQLSVDGVQESKSNSVSLDVYSIKKKNCRCIYPLKIIRPINKHFVPFRPHLSSILSSITRANCTLDALVADNLKRSNLKETLNHASNFGCEYCVSKAVQYKEKNINPAEERKKTDLKIKKFLNEIEILKKNLDRRQT